MAIKRKTKATKKKSVKKSVKKKVSRNARGKNSSSNPDFSQSLLDSQSSIEARVAINHLRQTVRYLSNQIILAGRQLLEVNKEIAKLESTLSQGKKETIKRKARKKVSKKKTVKKKVMRKTSKKKVAKKKTKKQKVR
ncbi:MAG: hypothetical protein HKP55_06610 [Gammaproteobacteria bacterium]|nr:hypothetical protein [Gammaproteobacteria bacterium]